MYELVDRQNRQLATEGKECTFQPKINAITSDILSQSDKYAVDNFLARVETYGEQKEAKVKKL